MSDFIWVLLVILSLCVAAYQRLPLMNAIIVAGGVLLVGTIFGSLGLLSWLVFIVVMAPFAVPSIRIPYLTKPMLAFYRKVMPEMSTTEQEAIDAGTVWWDGEIFSGRPDWQKLHAIPMGRLTSEEQAFLDGPVDKVCSMIDE